MVLGVLALATTAVLCCWQSLPARLNIQPTQGTRKSEALAIHFISRGSRERRRMSSIDWWLATTTNGPPPGQRPSTASRQGGKVPEIATARNRMKRPATARLRSKGAVTASSTSCTGSAITTSAIEAR